MAERGESAREAKASRVRVWQAADRVLKSGRRPTVEGIREVLGGGSPNSVTQYLNDWYRELGGRLAAAETPLAAFPSEAVSLMSELWRIAGTDQRDSARAGAGGAARASEAERDSLKAEAKALQILNQEMQRHRASVEKALAETRALLLRREAALEEERTDAAAREQVLAQTRMELEIALERLRLGAGRARHEPTRRSTARPQPRRATKTARRKKPKRRAGGKPARGARKAAAHRRPKRAPRRP